MKLTETQRDLLKRIKESGGLHADIDGDTRFFALLNGKRVHGGAVRRLIEAGYLQGNGDGVTDEDPQTYSVKINEKGAGWSTTSEELRSTETSATDRGEVEEAAKERATKSVP